eukprot:comp21666_c0_seq1/m.30477 comp21666_c0_seq1/g.30477  ORF comp21666_c0_seq1/g.30477 comp21666_c0_seq1/m.30477 type:complete len:531 (-) comp21666_c0_seq1:86-1678(-)
MGDYTCTFSPGPLAKDVPTREYQNRVTNNTPFPKTVTSHRLKRELRLKKAPLDDFGATFVKIGRRIYVARVRCGTPAYAAGLMIGDWICRYDNNEAGRLEPERLSQYLTNHKEITLEGVDRELCTSHTLEFTARDNTHGIWYEGGRITNVLGGSAAARAHLRVGQTIISINWEEVLGASDDEIAGLLHRAYAKGSPVLVDCVDEVAASILVVARNGSRKTSTRGVLSPLSPYLSTRNLSIRSYDQALSFWSPETRRRTESSLGGSSSSIGSPSTPASLRSRTGSLGFRRSRSHTLNSISAASVFMAPRSPSTPTDSRSAMQPLNFSANSGDPTPNSMWRANSLRESNTPAPSSPQIIFNFETNEISNSSGPASRSSSPQPHVSSVDRRCESGEDSNTGGTGERLSVNDSENLSSQTPRTPRRSILGFGSMRARANSRDGGINVFSSPDLTGAHEISIESPPISPATQKKKRSRGASILSKIGRKVSVGEWVGNLRSPSTLPAGGSDDGLESLQAEGGTNMQEVNMVPHPA